MYEDDEESYSDYARCIKCGGELDSEGWCAKYCTADDFPEDYEPCGECGYDHSYEPQEVYRAHYGERRVCHNTLAMVPREEGNRAQRRAAKSRKKGSRR